MMQEKDKVLPFFILRRRGTFVYADGRMYVGSWVSNSRQGFGTFYWSNGASFAGEWFDNLRSGHGMMTWADKTTYEGTFVHDAPKGTLFEVV